MAFMRVLIIGKIKTRPGGREWQINDERMGMTKDYIILYDINFYFLIELILVCGFYRRFELVAL